MRAAKGALGLLTAALVLLSVGPLVLPFRVFPVLVSSMAPAIPAGSALLVTRVPAAQLRVGDVVTFQPPGSDAFVTSRVYSLGPNPQTKADAHSTPDPWRLSREGSGWRAVDALPLLGYPLAPVSDPQGRLLVTLLVAAALAGLFLLERRRRAPRPRAPKAARRVPRSLVGLAALLALTVPATLAAFLAKTTNAAESFTNVAMVSPTAPAGSYTPSSVVLTWTAPSPMNGNGYAISAVNNGASSTCPTTISSYTTYVGSTASTTLTDLGTIAQGTQGTYACYLIQTGYNRAGAPPWAAIPQWTSQTSLATVAVRLGVQNVQIGPRSAVGTTTITATLPVASTAGDLLVANVRSQSTATQSTASAGWVFANGVNDTTAGRSEIWYYPNNPGGITSASFTVPTGLTGLAQITEWKNVSKAAPLDRTGTVDVTTNSFTATVSTTGATTLGNELAIVNGGFTANAAQVITPAAGWTSFANDPTDGYSAQYRYDRPAGVISELLTGSAKARWSAVIATFK